MNLTYIKEILIIFIKIQFNNNKNQIDIKIALIQFIKIQLYKEMQLPIIYQINGKKQKFQKKENKKQKMKYKRITIYKCYKLKNNNYKLNKKVLLLNI